MELDIRRERTNCSLDIEEPRGGPPRQMRWVCCKHRSTRGGLEASPTNTGHTCLTPNLCIRFRNRSNHRLLCNHYRWRGLNRRNESISPRSGTILRGRSTAYVGSRGLKVRGIYRRGNRLWDRGRLIIRDVGSRIIGRGPCPWYIIRWSTGAGAASSIG